jgi:hypothetical protein
MDLNALNAALAGLGPWGVLIGVGLTFGAQWLRAKMKQPAAPTSPVAPPVAPAEPIPAPPSAPPVHDAPEPKRPLLDALNAVLTDGGGVAPEHRGPLIEALLRGLHPALPK